jgi:murein DD-endopeptidase MepM/ murein hydrolase activator NlpD
MSAVTQFLVLLLSAVGGATLLAPEIDAPYQPLPAVEAGVVDPPADALAIILPTSNRRLLDDDGPGFYMYVDRNFRGQQTRPWEGGQWGFVRNPRVTPQGIVYTRFHAGIDIQPLYRDRAGEPLDTVRTIDDGRVVYVNNAAGASNYGIYVVVEHQWSGASFYSLYAHLMRTDVRRGQIVRRGDALGRLGYTGSGINRRRAHVHLEVNILLSRNFQEWFDRHLRPAANPHGVFNGLNMASLDVTSLYLDSDRRPALTITEFFESKQPYFRVAVPNTGRFDFMHRYAFLVEDPDDDPPAWEISFTRWGLPIGVRSYPRPVSEPLITGIERSSLNYEFLTAGLVSGSGEQYTLSQRGRRLIELVTLGAADDSPLLTD